MQVVDVVDTQSGVRQSTVFPSAGSVNRVLNDMGSGSHTFPNAMPLASRASLRSLYQLWARTIVVSIFLDAFGLQKKALYGGVIQCRSFDFNTGELDIQHADIRSILSRRYTFGTNGYSGNTSDNKLEIGSHTLAAIAPWVVWAGTQARTDGNYSLPIELSDSSEVGTDYRIYYDYNFTTLDAGLTELQDVGPDIDFEPMWSDAGTFYWKMRTGTGAQPQITGARFDWMLTAPEPGIFDVKVTEDGTKMSTTSFAVGTGSEVDMMVATATGSSSLPALERMVSYKGADQGMSVLQAHANSDQATHTLPTEQWEFSIFASKHPGAIALGVLHYIGSWDHGWVEDGWRKTRAIGYSMTVGSDKVRIQTQPIGGA